MSSKFIKLAKQLELTTCIGDLVEIAAPTGSLAAAFNGVQGELREFCAGGWIVARLAEIGDRRFRADEMVVI